MKEFDRFPRLGAAPRVDARLLGVSIFVEGADHLPVHVSFETGVNVLYGLNGAGKTRTLRYFAGLTGRGPTEHIQAAFIQTCIDPHATLDVIYDDAGMTNLVDQVAAALQSSMREYDWHEIAQLIAESGAEVDFDVSDGTLYTGSTTIQGLIRVLITARGLEPWLVDIACDASRFLLRPRKGGGVDVYLGLPASELKSLWSLGIDVCQNTKSVPVTEPEWMTDESPFTGFEWMNALLDSDWSRLVRREWERRMNKTRPGCLEGAPLFPVDTYLERQRAASKETREAEEQVGTLPTFALAYVLGCLSSGVGGAVTDPPLPPWAAIPIMYLGTAYEAVEDWTWDFGAVVAGNEDLDGAISELEQDLRQVLLDIVAANDLPMFDTSDGEVRINRVCQEQLREFSATATALFQEVLGSSAPELDVEVDPEEAVKTGTPIRVVADDYAVLKRVDVRDLSEAYRRWALIALRVSYASTFRVSGPANLLLLDEPDGSLHVLGRRAVAEGLTRLTERLGITAFVTTHAVELIDQPAAKLWHTSRVEGKIALASLSVSELAKVTAPDAAKWGLRNSDLLLLTRCWLIVEGDHDEAVLDAWIGDELRYSLVRILKMRGTRRVLSVLDSQLLLDGSDAPIVVLTDNTRASLVAKLNRLLAGLSEDPTRGGPIGRELQHLLQSHTQDSEERTIIELAIEAQRRRRAYRLTLLGLSKPDIIEYLPASVFVPEASWPALVSEWKSTTPAGSRPTFKDWLRTSKSAKISTEILRSAVSPDAIPEDITRILSVTESAIAAAHGG